MRLPGFRRILVLTALFPLALPALSRTAWAQQVTYYDFDVPQANPSQVSRQCSTPAAPGVLFCFNDATGQGLSPSFISDTYPPSIDPTTTDNPPIQSTHNAVKMTFSQPYQGSSMWFALPQKVSSGFTTWFAFKITPNPNSAATADGLAFVIQNSAGGGGTSLCPSTGSGLSIVGGVGGCIGYGGIDNSLAIEFDTFRNPWDPDDEGASLDDNHIAIQNCGPGLPNSPEHDGPCLVSLNVNDVLEPAINSNPGVTLADGNVHQVVISYSGPNEAVPNLLQIYIDPPFVPGTHTPAAGAAPVLSGVYNLAANLNLMNSGTANDSAYVGFTAATGQAFEQHEIMAWTYTPHAATTQTQPLSPPGEPTLFPFGSHVYAVTYPVNGPSTSGIDMVVTANPISPTLFSQLISRGPFKGSECQVYDDTGGNCIVYSVFCVDSATSAATECPASDSEAPIATKSSYNNSIAPVSPGFLRGDPFYTLVSSIDGNGQTATVTCSGECSVKAGQIVTIAGSQPAGFNGTITVLAADPSTPDIFTFASRASGTAAGGYLTSNNLQNIFVSYSPVRIDGTTSGRTDNFSDFVTTSVTASAIATLSPTNLDFGTLRVGDFGVLPVTLTNTGNVSMTVENPFIFDVENRNSKNFIALNLCPRTLAPGRSCSIFVAFFAGPNYGLQTAVLKIVDSAPGSPQSVSLEAKVIQR